jgi:alkyldihydroxyacetonephosphate synthase
MTRVTIDAEALRRNLEDIVGPRRVSMRETDLVTYSRDMWPRLLLAIREQGLPSSHRPHAVVWPESVGEVAALVRLARSLKVPVIPYGGGSGVCGGVVPIRGGITIDLKRMDNLHGVQGDDMLCDVDAGANGERFERELARRGYTFGHFPSSIYCSTVGGWLATRAAGQFSTKYGKVEDRVAGLTVVTGRGDIIKTDGPARATRGPDWTQLFLGNEGTLGIITSARLRLAPAPAIRILRGYQLESVQHGVEAIRRVMQRGLRPAVVRLYDEVDTLIHSLRQKEGQAEHGDGDRLGRFAPAPERDTGALPAMPAAEAEPGRGRLGRALEFLGSKRSQLGHTLRRDAMSAALARPRLFNGLVGTVAERALRRGCKLIIGLEGARVRTETEARLTFGEIERAGGRDLGEGPGRDWLAHRYSISYAMSPTFRDGAFVDTMEVASSWESLLDLYNSVREAIGRHALVMAHFSHAYQDGCSIYFTFAATGKDRRDSERIYDAIWRDGLTAVTRVGGTISHHHGVGLLKSAHMAGEHREAMTILRALKQTLDPDGILNPGKLGLDGVGAGGGMRAAGHAPEWMIAPVRTERGRR